MGRRCSTLISRLLLCFAVETPSCWTDRSLVCPKSCKKNVGVPKPRFLQLAAIMIARSTRLQIKAGCIDARPLPLTRGIFLRRTDHTSGLKAKDSARADVVRFPLATGRGQAAVAQKTLGGLLNHRVGASEQRRCSSHRSEGAFHSYCSILVSGGSFAFFAFGSFFC